MRSQTLSTELRSAIACFNAEHSLNEMVAAAGYALKRKGAELCGPCPSCGEGDDRFYLRRDGMSAGCRVCGTSGDALTWAMALADVPSKPGNAAAFLRSHGYLTSCSNRRNPFEHRPDKPLQSRTGSPLTATAVPPELLREQAKRVSVTGTATYGRDAADLATLLKTFATQEFCDKYARASVSTQEHLLERAAIAEIDGCGGRADSEALALSCCLDVHLSSVMAPLPMGPNEWGVRGSGNSAGGGDAAPAEALSLGGVGGAVDE